MADLKELLKKLGIDAAKAEDKDANLDTIIEDFHKGQRTHYETILKNEGWKNKDDYDSTVKTYDGKLNGQLNQELKKLGLELSVIEPLTIKEKFAKLKEFQEAENEKADKSGKGEVLKLQEENLKYKNEIAEFPAKIEAAKNESKTEYENKIKSDKISLKQKETFVGVPKERVIGNQHSDGMFKAVNATISATYDADIDEQGNLIYYNKGSKTRPTSKMDGKEVLMSANDITLSVLKELNFYVESNGKGAQVNQGQQQSQSQQSGQQGKTPKPVPSEMEARLAEMTKQ